MSKDFTGCVDNNGNKIYYGDKLVYVPNVENPDYDQIRFAIGDRIEGIAEPLQYDARGTGFAIRIGYSSLLFKADGEPCYEVSIA